MTLSIDPRISRINPMYRIYLLYIEPFIALSGAYLAYFQPNEFLVRTAPWKVSQQFIHIKFPKPVIKLLSTDIAALYIFFAINEAVVLRLTRDYSVWQAVVFAMLMSDMGHILAIYQADPVGSLNVAKWQREEYVNNGIIAFGVILRLGFLSGFGNGKDRRNRW
ncbi:hypothetical protein SS1G_13721 [Sclerotinia sclerotiorum 1980 UF-70]|uniref:DUF7704 domain-containing protein n=2 Tax=Sclerotinia sclerotiorum (strain ATCC 18683 / 1980 / Ss-1) TaxID=665079 RepID=A7F7Z1_SCLS1|nr:hypothetical protein SS1G_13721 [Sclerotinia sclerotiorum 1980 UF-70]APA14947.1 hypothetical protein sscle_14g097170 [Sclerotinia sclerotiorum 1980 UF-70]EDN98862.1 hypothetical protein SS1G_13721 [Sclerotinia sclerotiorum 1980 UF-70]